MQLIDCPDCGVDITLYLRRLYETLEAKGIGTEGIFELGPRCVRCEKALSLWVHIFWDFVDTRKCLPGVH